MSTSVNFNSGGSNSSSKITRETYGYDSAGRIVYTEHIDWIVAK